MSLITFILVAALIGLLTWAVTNYLPMPAGVKNVIVAAVVIGLILWLIGAVLNVRTVTI